MNTGIMAEGLTTALHDAQYTDLLPTLRDRFAMAALHGLLAADAGPRGYSRQSYRDDDPECTARDAYRLADAMIAARAAKPEPGK